MPPPGKGKGAAAKPIAIAAEPAKVTLSPEAAAAATLLRQKCASLLQQKAFEEAASMQYHEEKDRLQHLWVVAKADLGKRKADLVASEKLRKDAAERGFEDIRAYQKRIKHLVAEHAAEAARSVQNEQALAVQSRQERHRSAEFSLSADRRDLKQVLLDMEASHEEHVKTLKVEQDRVAGELRAQFDQQFHDIYSLYDERQARMREDMGRAREHEIKQLEMAKCRHIATLVAGHAKSFNDIKLYFNEITHSNLDLVKMLKEELDELRRREANDERVMYEIATENKKMSDPMRRVLDEISRLRNIREEYRADIQALATAKQETAALQAEHNELKWQHEVLTQRQHRLQAEQGRLTARLTDTIHEVQKRTELQRLQLHRQAARIDGVFKS